MKMRLTRVDISKMFDLHLLCKMHKVQVFTCSRKEAEADEFAARFTNPAAVRTAREETELVRQRIRYARAGIYTPAST